MVKHTRVRGLAEAHGRADSDDTYAIEAMCADTPELREVYFLRKMAFSQHVVGYH